MKKLMQIFIIFGFFVVVGETTVVAQNAEQLLLDRIKELKQNNQLTPQERGEMINQYMRELGMFTPEYRKEKAKRRSISRSERKECRKRLKRARSSGAWGNRGMDEVFCCSPKRRNDVICQKYWQ